MSTDELLEQAKALPLAEQVELVEALLNELDRPDKDIDGLDSGSAGSPCSVPEG
jgi:hypothetical protein